VSGGVPAEGGDVRVWAAVHAEYALKSSALHTPLSWSNPTTGARHQGQARGPDQARLRLTLTRARCRRHERKLQLVIELWSTVRPPPCAPDSQLSKLRMAHNVAQGDKAMDRDRSRRPGGWVQERLLRSARRPPPRWQLAVSALLAAGVTMGLWNRRGVATGLVALLAYGSLVVFDLRRRRMGDAWLDRATAWTRRHPIADAALGPLLAGAMAFCALALATTWALSTCVLVAAGIAVTLTVLLLVAVWQRTRTASD